MPASARKSSARGAQRRRKSTTTTISASVPSPLAARTVAVAARARWKVSQVVAQALALYTALPASALQHLAELEHRIAEEPGAGDRTSVMTRLADGVERVLDRMEWEAVARATQHELGAQAADFSDPEALDRAADQAIAASRAARRRTV